MNPKVKNKNASKKHDAFLYEHDDGLPLFPDNNDLYFNEVDRDEEVPMELSAKVPERVEMVLQENLQSRSGVEAGMDIANGITTFQEEPLFPELPEVGGTKQDEGVSGVDNWGDELLVLLPELQDLTDRGNFVTGRTSGDNPGLPEILGKLSETSEKLERISGVIEKFEQEYRT